MRWRKLGKIFDPTTVRLQAGCEAFAQAPQALILEDIVRVYFSTRSIDGESSKHRSHVAFVDFDRSLKAIRRVSNHEVIPLGGLGAFDEHGIFPMSVLRHEDQIFGFLTGWSRRISVPVETAIGLAVSRDNGETFERVGDGPLVAASLHEPFLVGDGFVKVIDRTFHMWYIFGTDWAAPGGSISPERTYKIGHAVSDNGIEWVKEEGRRIISDRLGATESQALPTVVEVAGRFHMFFCYRETFDFRTNPSRAYRIGHAYSDDLREWVRDDSDPLLEGGPDSWDRDMQCYPHAFELDGRVVLLYNGNEFGRYGFGAAVLDW